MSDNQALPTAKFKIGDCVFDRDNNTAGIVVTGAVAANAQSPMYILMEPDGSLFAQSENALVGVDSTRYQVADLQGRSPFAISAAVAIASDTSNAGGISEADDQMLFTVEYLADLILANAPQNTPVYEAFAAFSRTQEPDLDKQNIQGVIVAARNAMSVWQSQSDELRRQYANGWYMPQNYPTAREWHVQESQHDDVNTAWFIDLHMMPSGHAFAFSGFKTTNGNNAVSIRIQEGADKKTVITELAMLMAEIQLNWERIISIQPYEGSQDAAWASGDKHEKKRKPRTVNPSAQKLAGKERKGLTVAA